MTRTATSTASTGGAGGGHDCVVWSAGFEPPLALTDPNGDSMLTGVAADGDFVFVASANNNDPTPRSRRRAAAPVDTAGNAGAPHTVAVTAALIDGVATARVGTRALVGWTSHDGDRRARLRAVRVRRDDRRHVVRHGAAGVRVAPSRARAVCGKI